jgi:hypothetical protein
MSSFGTWVTRDEMPAFEYGAALAAEPHQLLIGNRCVQLCANADGTTGLWDERYGGRWLTLGDPTGTGSSTITESSGRRWGTASGEWPAGTPPTRTFGPTSFEVACQNDGLRLERLTICPEGEAPWVLVRVRVRNASARPRRVEHVERWAVVPQFVNIGRSPEQRADDARSAVRYQVEAWRGGLAAIEERTAEAAALASHRYARVYGPEVTVVLEPLGDTGARTMHSDAPHPVLALASEIVVQPGEETMLWFRFGAEDGTVVGDPGAVFADSVARLKRRLPQASAVTSGGAASEIPWHAAILTGGACRDEVLGNHTLNQGSAYGYRMGFNGAARDPLQHALPLVYIEPDLALSVLRNTCSWATPEGDLPYALDGAKRPSTELFQPSDQNLWALWLAAEYAAGTGDLHAFDEQLAYHPAHNAPSTTLGEHLRRQFFYFKDVIGTGEHGHVRMRNADWNDAAIALSGVERRVMIEHGESVLNSAFAAWVLPVYAGLCDRLGDSATAQQARTLGEQLRARVADEWNGRWFRRAYVPGKGALGDDDCWLEVQPWAILCGAADDARARDLLRTIGEHMRANSPLGARVKWPVPPDGDVMGLSGEGTAGGTWFSINMTLVWAAARLMPELAWDEWRRMTLAAHANAYPGIWEGTLSGPDSYNTPESPRAGHTWGTAMLSMQQFPVNNMHSHSAPLLGYLRLLGIEPGSDGELRVGGGGTFQSEVFRLSADGHGSVRSSSDIHVQSRHGATEGRRGVLEW